MPKEHILRAWIDRMTAAGVLMAKPTEAEAQLGGWLELLFAAAEGDTGSEAELYRLVAMHGRGLGQSGRPASAAILQPLFLEDAITKELGADHPYAGRTRELVKIVADAHALGQAERLEEAHRQLLRKRTPVLRIGSEAVVGWVLGPMTGDTIDAILGRIFAECAGAGASRAVLDLSPSGPPNDVLFRTIVGYAKSDIAPKYRLVLTGIDDIPAAEAALFQLRADLSRVELHERLHDYLATLR